MSRTPLLPPYCLLHTFWHKRMRNPDTAHWPIDPAHRGFGYNHYTEYSTGCHSVGILTCQLKQTSPGASGASALGTAALDTLFEKNKCARQ